MSKNIRILSIFSSFLYLVLPLTYALFVIPQGLMDDAYISFRYAENWANGFGPVFNPGQPPVEGYTSFLWVALLTVAYKLGFDLETFSIATGILSLLLLVVLLINSYRYIPFLSVSASRIAALLSTSSASLTIWALLGMETLFSSFFFILTVFTWLSLRTKEEIKWSQNLFFGLLILLSCLARPEAALLLLIIFIDALAQAKKEKEPTKLLAPLLAFFGLGIFLLWRYLYYGWLLPNTFYAKVGLSFLTQAERGLYYSLDFLLSSGILFLLFCLIMLRVSAKKEIYPLVVLVLVYTMYILLIGGDSMAATRFFVPILPLFLLFLAESLNRIRAPLLLFSILAMFTAYQVFIFFDHPTHYRTIVDMGNKFAKGKEVGNWFRTNTPPDAVIAVNTAGTVPYFSQRPSIDTLGLNDSHIAHRAIPRMGEGVAGHEKGDGTYVLSRKPDYIMFGCCQGKAQPVFLGDHEVYALSDFHQNYLLTEVKLDSGTVLTFYKRRDLP